MSVEEIWKPIVGYEGLYSVSTLGAVRNDKTNKILKPRVHKRGYRNVCLCKPGLHKNCTVHRLVAIAFIPNPLHKKEVDHRDRNRANNHIENLRWSTRSENASNNNALGYYFDKRAGKWKAQTLHNGKYINIGLYDTESEARVAYLDKVKEIKGEFAQPSQINDE